jgi:CelD/BcsL family acetyltransferase involved in cellulose biosynthesis
LTEGITADRASARIHPGPADLEPLRADWDALAVRCGAPFGAPAWVEAWWRHLAPRGMELAVVSVHDGERLIGLAPFYASRKLGVTELRLLSGGFSSRLGLLAEPGLEQVVATSVAACLATSRRSPGAVRWEAVDIAADWPELVSSNWPGGPQRIQAESRRSAPVVDLEVPSYDEWMARKSRNFRSQMRRRRRAVEERGASFRAATRATLEADLEQFLRLHTDRWAGRGGSAAVPPGVMAMLAEVGNGLVDEDRFRLWLIDGPDGKAISAQIFVEAGGVLAYWNGGFDEAWGEHSPGSLAILAAIEQAIERGDSLLDLGGGEAAYKDRLADEDRPIAWSTAFVRGPRYPLARMRRLPGQVARSGSQGLRRRIGQERLNRLRGLLSR